MQGFVLWALQPKMTTLPAEAIHHISADGIVR
jgi:hypothetical protein